MKDIPRHINKLNRRIIRSMQPEEAEKLPDIPTWPVTEKEEKKKRKRKLKAEGENRVITPVTAEEKNRRKKKRDQVRFPQFDLINNPKSKTARTTKKKTPRI